jgi:hypothetical protein
MDEERIKKIGSEEPFSERFSVVRQSKEGCGEFEPMPQVALLVAAQL